jgi:hypothetical protein
MNRLFAVASAIAIVFAPQCVADEASDQAAAKAVIDRGVKAAKWDKLPTNLNMTWKEKGSLSAFDMKINYTAEWAFSAPDKYRFVVKVMLGDQAFDITVVVNNDKAWEAAMGMVQEPGAEKLEYMRGQVYHLYVITLNPLLKDAEFQLKPLPDKDVDGKAAAGVEVKRKGKPNVNLYFDKATGLCVKSETRTKDEFQGWKEVPEDSFFSDWKDAGEIKVFGKLKTVRDGKPLIEADLSDQKRPERLDAKLFEKPEGK